MANKGFRGLNNVTDPRQLDVNWLEQADNVDVTNHFALTRCRGFTKRTTNFAITGAYATEDMQRLYVIDSGELRQMNPGLGSYTVLKTGLSPQHTYFEEVNGLVYYANGVDYGVIDNTSAQAWGVDAPGAPLVSVSSGVLHAGTYQVLCSVTDARGIESSNSPVTTVTAPEGSQLMLTNIPQVAGHTTNVYVTVQDGTVYFLLKEGAGPALSYNCGPNELGRELTYWNVDLPRGVMPAHFQGQMYIAEPIPEVDQTVVWCSLPLQFHHFDYGGDGFIVPGTVRMLRAIPDALIVGTDRHVWAYDGDKLSLLANYGVVTGWHASKLDERLYFWTLRGLCRALPFENLTQNTVSVAPGLVAGATVIERDGMRRYVVAMQKGGVAYNSRG